MVFKLQRMCTRIMLVAIFLTSLSACRTTNNHSAILFLETGRLIDGVHDTVFQDLDIIVIGGRIAGVGKDLKVPAHARVVNLKNYTVLPSLIDKQKIIAQRGKPMEAIKSATSMAAKAWGQENKTGSISPGLYANLIAIEGDPLEDIRQLENVKVVIHEGILVFPP